MSPLFTVVMPTYNRADVLPRALGSVLRQTISDFELIVVDDGSMDETRAVIESVDDPRVRYVFKQNGGLSAARNTGVAHSGGLYVTFLDDDDEALPEWLQAFSETIEFSHPAVVCSGALFLDERGNLIRVRLPGTGGPMSENQKGLFMAGTFAVKRDVFDAVGGYAEGTKRSQNTELSWRLIPFCVQNDLEVASIDAALVKLHRHTRHQGYAEGKLLGTKYMIEQHSDRLSRHPKVLSTYLAIAGVNCARTGDFGEARRFFWQAIQVRPIGSRNYARLFTTLVPGMRTRVWS